MGKRIGTHQRKTRYKYKRHYREQGKTRVSQFFQQLELGDKVGLKINSSYQYGRFFPRFHGLTGTIAGKKGFCYIVEVKDQHKEKSLYVHPIHLQKQ
ncbi:MAG: hypothetical protein A2817_01110 [Candidatus Yanofskybacteria bacterium RIFCSPHIGHO2_01_FULL_39_8b]|uniref:Large ribosomal subunit protein eL21 n=1 Tax=Candidatus Yanofskybacteria bacterium RIFCSPHIGHO2_01_FULL_39_8b TaxID=1802659 RepID=A0A1F8ECQ7_9BACT|nr:MAG: hypothetical protein A2817_01110 [Candidatus Yanofskybacteria bacterium RIFCSPHIGHO2_01_FULL_39_8b]